MYMKELTIQDIETIVHRDENRVMEAKETTGELVKGMQSGCAFLNTDGGWLFFGIHPTRIRGTGTFIHAYRGVNEGIKVCCNCFYLSRWAA